MRILKAYVLKEWLCVFLLSLTVVSFVLLVGNVAKIVELIVSKGVYAADVLRLFLFLLPSLLIFSIPVAALTATLLTFGRLASDNEITAMRSSGIGIYPFVLNLLLLGALLSSFCLYLNDSLIPASHYNARMILKKIGLRKPLAYLEEKTFIKVFNEYIVFIYKIKNDTFEDIRIYQPQENRPTRTIIARQGAFIPIPEQNAVKLELRSGMADEPSFDNPEVFYKLNFKTYHLTLHMKSEEEREKLNKKVQDMSIKELLVEIESMRMMNVDERPLLVGLHKKFSLAFSSLVFILAGIPLALRVKRRERSIGFGISLIVCVSYYLLMALGESLALRNKIAPAAGVWLPNAVMLLFGLLLIFVLLEE